MSLYKGNNLISGISQNTKYNAHHLLDFKWTDCIMNDVSWLRADTFSWQSGGVYVSAYNHLVQDIQGITAETEVVGSYTITFYRATDGHKICLADQEQTVANIYNSYGIAWYYIVDTANTQFKLPRTKYGFEGVRGNVGDKIDESLPNITGTLGTNWQTVLGGLSGAFYTNPNATSNANTTSGANSNGVLFDASRSSSTYQNNAPVQERATQMYLYFYVGDYSQTAIEQTAGLNADLFNGKADVTALTTKLNNDYSNIKLIGSPTLNNHVLSGFSDSNYAIVPAGFSPDSNTWEMVFKFTYVTAAQNQVVVDVNDGTLFTRPISIFTKASTNTLAYGLSSVVSTNTSIYDIIAESNGSNTLTSGITYYVKLEFTGSAYNGYISTDGETWTLDITATSSTAIAGGYKPYIGWWHGGRAFMTGTIDLNESYININGQRWWRGVANADNFDNLIPTLGLDKIQDDLGTKVNYTDIWYNSSNATLYIGVPQS